MSYKDVALRILNKLHLFHSMYSKNSRFYFETLWNKSSQYVFISTSIRKQSYHEFSQLMKLNKTDEIRLFLQQRDLVFKNGWTAFLCQNIFQPSKQPSLKYLSYNKADFNHCYINKTTGYFYCPESGHKGSWRTFQDYCKSSNKDIFTQNIDLFECDLTDALAMWQQCKRFTDMKFEEVKLLLQEFDLSGLDYNNLKNYDIRCSADLNNLVIPYFDVTENHKQFTGFKVIRSKQYATVEECNVSTQAYTLYPQENFLGLFGIQDIVKSSLQRIVLTANEFDAMAINASSSKYFAAALPLGVTALPLEILPLLEHVSEIILWFGNSLLSLEALHIFAKKLGAQRCKMVRPQKDSSTAFIALKNGFHIDRIINLAVPAVMKNVVSFVDLQREVKDEIYNREKYAGVPFKRFQKLNELLKGHRRGELTIITGPTGSGKTTLLSELSLDLAMQGVSTLWGSFEINNKRLLVCMLKQFARLNLESNLDKYSEISNKFSELPLQFMSYNGPEDIDNVISTMHHLVYTNDIQHIIIDNLQFMLGMKAKFDRFTYQDFVIDRFRQFATKWNVHITLVAHPRKEDQNLPLQLSAVFGSAKATQEADNVLILQQIKKFDEEHSPTIKYLEVAKNRYDGDLGRIKLYFNRHTLCMSSNNYPSYVSTMPRTHDLPKTSSEFVKISNSSANCPNIAESEESTDMAVNTPKDKPQSMVAPVNQINFNPTDKSTDDTDSSEIDKNSWINKFIEK